MPPDIIERRLALQRAIGIVETAILSRERGIISSASPLYIHDAPRFYCPVDISIGQIIELPASIAHHAARVLRLEHGSKLILFNGHGGEFRSVIAQIGRNSATALIEKYLPIERESPLSVTLAQAIVQRENGLDCAESGGAGRKPDSAPGNKAKRRQAFSRAER